MKWNCCFGKRNGRAKSLLCAVVVLVATSSGSHAAHGAHLLRKCTNTLHTGRGVQVILLGTLERVLKWGPPNFGEDSETDERVWVWVLKLDYAAPVDIEGLLYPDALKIDYVRQIQIDDRGPGHSISGYFDGRHVEVKGTLWPQQEWYDYTHVTTLASSIRLSQKRGCAMQAESKR